MQSEDIILWPDGTSCYADELEGMAHKSDDYKVLKQGTQEWQDAKEQMGDD